MRPENWIRETIEHWVDDFLDDDSGTPIDADIAPHAEELLQVYLWQACAVRGVPPGELELSDLREALLEGLQSHPLPEKIRGRVPRFLGEFLADLERRGRLGAGKAHGRKLAAMRGAFLEAQAEKPRPVTRPGMKIGRNDPCPCGSGRKYKKCCQRGSPPP